MTSSQHYAELHVHLEGAIDRFVLQSIDPQLSASEIEARYAFDSFPGFIQAFKWAILKLETPDHFRLLARHLFAQLAAQGIVYAEIIHSVGVCLWRGQDTRAIIEALLEEGRRAPLRVRWILDATRQFGAEHVMDCARLVASYAGSEVIGFGVGGDETATAAEEMLPAFRWAREAGLHILPHAGETSNAQNIWGALSLGAERIGHGIRAIEDPELLRELARRRIPLEISLSSNVMTGAVASMAAHPARRIYQAGVPILLNTDDPAFFGCTLAGEFQLAASVLGFTPQELEEIRQNGFSFAVDPPAGF
jgi:aminodeoxyfutalosine deaminase